MQPGSEPPTTARNSAPSTSADAGQAGNELAVETEHSLSESDQEGGRQPPGRECKRLPADGFHGGLGKPVRPRGSSHPIFLRCRQHCPALPRLRLALLTRRESWRHDLLVRGRCQRKHNPWVPGGPQRQPTTGRGAHGTGVFPCRLADRFLQDREGR
jgi:hypothetical protein